VPLFAFSIGKPWQGVGFYQPHPASPLKVHQEGDIDLTQIVGFPLSGTLTIVSHGVWAFRVEVSLSTRPQIAHFMDIIAKKHRADT